MIEEFTYDGIVLDDGRELLYSDLAEVLPEVSEIMEKREIQIDHCQSGSSNLSLAGSVFEEIALQGKDGKCLLRGYRSWRRRQAKRRAPTVREAHDAYLKAKEAEDGPEKCDRSRTNLETFLEMFADRPINSLTSDDGNRYKKALEAAGLDQETVGRRLAGSRVLMTWVCGSVSRRHQYRCETSPFAGLKWLPHHR